ncbi:hypothetical protein DQ04_07391000 [Trypanosoma grayi]|uniref:hypothetical protein n=1 Tax=Trypanosoma grayi TaxID=71804 RepID=UPI0004F44197|nr:hypothetical protein DQ04_07391000 [Trypanosoma grayi]KEG08351.1 hypothetical protein DQ04_07391000 [Trypanosoma grayi]
MEKYRKYADAATGINPFAQVRTPTGLSVAVAVLLFPLRLVSASLVALLLLLVVDVLAYAFFLLPGLSLVSRLLLAPCQRGLLRCLLFTLGNMGVVRKVPRGGSGGAAPAAGDVVVANMQSVWDMCVLEVAAQMPCCVVAFYVGGAGDKVVAGGVGGGGDDDNKRRKRDDAAALYVLEPSPLQRWRAWRHVYRTASLDFLHSVVVENSNSSTSNHSSGGAVVDLTPVQQRCQRLGVPLVFFAEGSCTNGKGMLNIPPFCTAAPPRRVFVSATDYDTTAVHTIVHPRHVVSLLFAMGASLYGSRDPAGYSPPFPTATVSLVAVAESAAAGGAGAAAGVVIDVARVRQALCAASRSRRPLAVGLREKCGFVQASTAQSAGGS